LASCRQGTGQRYGPAGSGDGQQRQNHVAELDLLEKTPDEGKIDPKNGHDKGKNGCDDDQRAQQPTRRLDVKCFQDSALGEGERRGGHAASRAGQAGSLLESTVAEPPARVEIVTSGQGEDAKENYDGHTDDRGDNPLLKRRRARKFWLI